MMPAKKKTLQLRSLMKAAAQWAVNNLDATVTREDAPSGAAWRFRTMALDDPAKFFTTVLPKYLTDDDEPDADNVLPADKKRLDHVEKVLREFRAKVATERVSKLGRKQRIRNR